MSGNLIDSKGKYVTNPDPYKVAKDNFYTDTGFSGLNSQIPDNEPYLNLNNGEQYFAARKMSNLCGWKLVAFGPISELYSELTDSLKIIIIISSIALFVAIIGSLFLCKLNCRSGVLIELACHHILQIISPYNTISLQFIDIFLY